jgi:hypothetical protein
MEELYTDNINGGHEGQLWARSRARERAYSNNHISGTIITHESMALKNCKTAH